ncbi:MAG: OsmC family protein [Lewinellaceae bacterium]|nr:OsmC family protein [Lewinellaceae bacterium]
MSRSSTISSSIGRDHYTTVLQARQHQVLGDEPEEHGGSDKGPQPDELLLCSLATCKIITLRMYADRKEWPLERIRATLTLTVNDSVRPLESQVHCRFEFEGDLDETQTSRLLEIADKCPTHKVLTGAISIHSELNKPA